MSAPALVRDLRMSIPQAIGIGAFTLLLYGVVVAIYRLYFDPLSKFPGPRLHAVSHVPFLYKEKVLGTWVRGTTELHAKYGPIVRISPNHLAIDGSIGFPQVFQRRANVPEFGKSVEFYQLGRDVILAADRENHRRQRRMMAHAFSAAALKEQEEYVQTHLDALIRGLHDRAANNEPVDITRWYNFLTFDIIGELAFGDPFGCLQNSDYHPFVSMIFDSIKAASSVTIMESFGILRPLLKFMVSDREIKRRDEVVQMARASIEKRVALGPDTRRDFMTYLLRNTGDKGMTHEELVVNSRALIVAGSETTATALSGLTFHLTREPEVYRRLAVEIRASFASEGEIDMRTTEALPYLHACLEEALRIYPPVAGVPPRISPGAEVAGHYLPEGTQVTVYTWAAHHNPDNFADPDRFVPERWLPTSHPLYDHRYAGDNKAAFGPFSSGARDCIGRNLAYAEMRLVVARMLWNFDMAVLESQDDWVSKQRVFSSLADKDALMVQLTPVRHG